MDTTEQLSRFFQGRRTVYVYCRALHSASREYLTHGRHSMDTHLMDNSDSAEFCFPVFRESLEVSEEVAKA